MPLTSKDKRMKSHFTHEYGEKEGERVYYATLNKAVNRGKPINTPEGRHVAAKRKHKKRKGKRGTRR